MRRWGHNSKLISIMTAVFAALAVLPYAFGVVNADGSVVLSLTTQTQET